MAKKRQSKGADVNLDSFLDIMTCLVGVLVLILILTGIDASQVRVLIPTPIEHNPKMRAIYIECRNDQLFFVPVRELREMTTAALDEVAEEAGGDMEEMLRLLHEKTVGNEEYSVDISYALVGQFVVHPVEGREGYPLENATAETEKDWFGRILTTLDPETEMISFLVRDDSFKVYKRARYIAWKLEVEVGYDLFAGNDVIKFGLGGSAPVAQ